MEELTAESSLLLSVPSPYNTPTNPPRPAGTSAPSPHPADAGAGPAGAGCLRSTIPMGLTRAGQSGRLCPVSPGARWLALARGHVGGSW